MSSLNSQYSFTPLFLIFEDRQESSIEEGAGNIKTSRDYSTSGERECPPDNKSVKEPEGKNENSSTISFYYARFVLLC